MSSKHFSEESLSPQQPEHFLIKTERGESNLVVKVEIKEEQAENGAASQDQPLTSSELFLKMHSKDPSNQNDDDDNLMSECSVHASETWPEVQVCDTEVKMECTCGKIFLNTEQLQKHLRNGQCEDNIINNTSARRKRSSSRTISSPAKRKNGVDNSEDQSQVEAARYASYKTSIQPDLYDVEVPLMLGSPALVVKVSADKTIPPHPPVVRRVTRQQLDILWEFLNSNRDIAVAYNRSTQDKEYAMKMWKKITLRLNSQSYGTQKDWRGWSKYWVDYKAKIKKRSAALRSAHRGTGEGSSTDQPLSDNEMKFLHILGEDFGQGLTGVRMEHLLQPSTSIAAAEVTDTESSILDPPPYHPILGAHLAENSRDSLQVDPPVHSAQTTPESPQTTPMAEESVAPVEIRFPRRRRRRLPPMTQEEARRALVKSTQQRAEATIRSSHALETIARGITQINNTLERIERTIKVAIPRTAE